MESESISRRHTDSYMNRLRVSGNIRKLKVLRKNLIKRRCKLLEQADKEKIKMTNFWRVNIMEK